ncbi:MAG: mechanosensitive ion channel [Clostridiaceae bacterium]|jgi:miniconductance mechanosensitive channel|nr:mechanosensitive ion channel [Clostridiaceae bacterium]
MDFIKEVLMNYGVNDEASAYLSAIIITIIVILLCAAANFITQKIILRLITHIVQKTKIKWDNILLEHRFFHKLSHIVPAIIIYQFASTIPEYKDWIEKFALFYISAVGIFALNAFLNALNDIYRNYEIYKTRPIKGFIQVVKIVVYIVGGITLISILIDKNPLILISGLGALSALIMLVFKDSILGFVAGVQLSANDMVRVGDWVEMPKYNADGDIIDITLNTVKVQNWDKTITMIPTYAFISDSFKNWRGMRDTGGRRIKRSIYIDTMSIQFCTREMLDYFKKIHYLTDYIENKEKEIEAYNRENKINRDIKVNGRNLTNIGTFRIYIHNYLKNHPYVHKDMIIMVRQLTPGEYGLPLEIYCFTNDTRWANYEAIQSDIFDHIFAVAPEFGLRIFQKPSGHDMRNLLAHKELQERRQ